MTRPRLELILALATLAVLVLMVILVARVQRPVSPSSTPTAAALATLTPSPTAAPTPTASPMPTIPVGLCRARGPLPDLACTPGATDPRITQANIASTICITGYTAIVRPPSSYTDALKVQQMKLYGDIGLPISYEEDHMIPLELGGDPVDPRNLWPEPRRSIGGMAEDKDVVENALHGDVCAGRITLAEAQLRIATDWTSVRR